MYNEIIKNLYVGDIEDVLRFEKDHPEGRIFCVLEIRPEEEPIDAHHIPLCKEISGQLRVNYVNKRVLLKLIHEHLIRGRKVLVHCGAGIERSPLAVACYLKDYHDLSLDEAYKIVKDHKPQAQDRRDWL